MEPLRLGVVGVGGRGSGLLKVALGIPEVKVTAVADVAQERVDAAVRQADCVGYTSHADLMDSGKVDAILIGTPHPFHATIAVDAAARGLHVLTEKPLSVEAAEGDQMVRATRAAGVRLGVMFQRRLEPLHAKAHEIVASGVLGELHDVEMVSTGWYRLQSYYGSGAWRATWKGEGGGILANQAPHDLDLLLWLGGRPSGVTASLRTRIHRIEVEDTVQAILQYGGHTTGFFKATTSDPVGRRSIELVGEMGRLVARDGKLMLCRYNKPVSEDILHSAERKSIQAQWEEIPFEKGGDSTAGVIVRFVHAVREGTPLVATGEDGLAAVELANAMHLSGFTHQPVGLPVDRRAVSRMYADLREGRLNLA